MVTQMESSADKPSRRGYGQYCAVASALDVLGERWTLLIVRDLMGGPKRYTDLRAGLPGMGTDLLTARLRALESAGFVARRTLPRPAPATVYELTEQAAVLRPVVQALARVGFQFLGRLTDDTELPADRLVTALHASFSPDVLYGIDATYELALDDELFDIAVRDGALEIARGPGPDADLTIRADPVTLARVLQGEADPDVLDVEGPAHELERFVTAFSWRAPATAN